MHYSLEYQKNPIQADENLLFKGIDADAAKKKGMRPIEAFQVIARDGKKAILGGISGVFIFGCLYVDMLWVDELHRQTGLGTKLMEEAERNAREKGCTFATLNTMDWQALPFYQKLGYQIEFIREGFENSSKMYLLRKKLS